MSKTLSPDGSIALAIASYGEIRLRDTVDSWK